MKIFNKMYYLVLALAVVFTLNNCSTDQISPQNEEEISTKDDMFAKKKVSSASGQAGLTFAQGEDGFNGNQSFSFHVSKDADGNVSGSWQSNYNDSMNDDYDMNTHGTIDCVTFNGNSAKIVGTVTHVNAGDFWMIDWGHAPVEVGEYAYFVVVDNGEGKNSDPDQFTDLFVGFNTDIYWWFNLETMCEYDLGFDLNDINYGNIQVKP